MASEKVSCLLNYYLRSGLEHSVIDVATILLERSPDDVYLQFWKAFGMYITGSVSQVFKFSLLNLVYARLKYGMLLLLYMGIDFAGHTRSAKLL